MKDVIAELRQRAHKVALERRQEWFDGLTPEQQKHERRALLSAEIDEAEELDSFKPGVIELDDMTALTPYAVQMQLDLVSCFVPLEELAARTREERLAASYWATTVGLNASDNDVMIGPRPEWLPGRDVIANEGAVAADYEKHGGIKAVERKFDLEFREAEGEFVEDPGETITVEQAALLSALEHLEEATTIIRKTLGLHIDPLIEADYEIVDTPEQQHRTDTSVEAERSARSTDGNASESGNAGSNDD